MACIAKRRGRYVIDFYDNQGKRRWKTLPQGTTKKKAREVLRDIEDQLSKGTYLTDKKIPTFKEVAEDWLVYKKPNVRASTWSVYEGHVRNHFNDVADIKVNRITVTKVEHFLADRQNEKMNLGTLRKIMISFGQIMAYAVRHKYIHHNPVREIERPRGNGNIDTIKIRVLNPAEIQRMLDAVEDLRHLTLFRLAVMSGARQGELLGLKWSDVLWDSKQIHIQRTFNNGGWYEPKSASSNRRIDLGPAMMAELKRWKKECPKSKLNLVFPNTVGNVMCDSSMLRKHFHPALKAANLPRIRFHDLRHTYASLLIEQGENIKYIQTQLGHSSPSVTLDVYAHLLKPSNQQAARRLEKSIFS